MPPHVEVLQLHTKRANLREVRWGGGYDSDAGKMVNVACVYVPYPLLTTQRVWK